MENGIGKEAKKKIRRENIVNAAETVFFLKGIDGATMDDVAKEVKYSKRTVYSYFESKEQLCYEITCRAFDMSEKMEQAALELNSLKNGLEKILVIGKAKIDFLNKYPDYFKFILAFNNMSVKNLPRDEVIMACYEKQSKLFSILTDILKEGIEDKSIRNDLNVINTSYILYLNIMSLIKIILEKENAVITDRGVDIDEIIETMFTLTIRSIKNYD
ncbi:TetR/AcrR family transcriptional regulator [Clostridium sp. BL-8]|uniref:TetR/AcrR family transcriptional regulator n=1 Tax=Clostridium sp. BL-8 TaxID=349938 RepID=UPI00098CDB5A|nr:TetR/AcrR family transcriptional regulator [Clostridium sp. BL-8]OOM74230.1 HTH-type transcriptional repressor KstR2 [Clostridium sp. BL-8]